LPVPSFEETKRWLRTPCGVSPLLVYVPGAEFDFDLDLEKED
jgi:hypothetical protein